MALLRVLLPPEISRKDSRHLLAVETDTSLVQIPNVLGRPYVDFQLVNSSSHASYLKLRLQAKNE